MKPPTCLKFLNSPKIDYELRSTNFGARRRELWISPRHVLVVNRTLQLYRTQLRSLNGVWNYHELDGQTI
jgi:hypothetical protein